MLSFCEFVIRLLYKDSIVLFPRYQTDIKYGEFTIRRVGPNMKVHTRHGHKHILEKMHCLCANKIMNFIDEHKLYQF